MKVHLIRRSSRRSALERRSCFLVDVERSWVERHELRDPAEALDLDLTVRGERWEEPLYLVCTHGKRDPCCARRGRPLARALRARAARADLGDRPHRRPPLRGDVHGVPARPGVRPRAGRPRPGDRGRARARRDRARAPARPRRGPVGRAGRRRARAARAAACAGLDALALERVDGASSRCGARDGERLRATVARRDDAPRPISCGAEPETRRRPTSSWISPDARDAARRARASRCARTTSRSPSPGRGQVLLEVHACGVCRTDLHLRDGEVEAGHLPLILGHQIVGTTADGRRVGVPWLGWTDGECDYCERGPREPVPERPLHRPRHRRRLRRVRGGRRAILPARSARRDGATWRSRRCCAAG